MRRRQDRSPTQHQLSDNVLISSRPYDEYLVQSMDKRATRSNVVMGLCFLCFFITTTIIFFFSRRSLQLSSLHTPSLLRKKFPIENAATIASLSSSALTERPHNSINRRIIAVGDIHGDKEAIVRALRLAKLVGKDNEMSWIGGTDILVQIGDLLNARESRDADVLSYITKLEKQAHLAGGRILIVFGDHDLQNAPALWREISTDPFPSWFQVVLTLDRNLFVHGSLTSNIFEKSGGNLEEMNKAVKAWIDGKRKKPDWIGRNDGPIWSRLYSNKASDFSPHCSELHSLLNKLSLDRMIVGHTVRPEGISSLCNERAWRIDVGLSRTESRAGKIGASEVLELNQIEGVKILSTDIKLKAWN